MGRIKAGHAHVGSVSRADHLAEFDQLSTWTNRSKIVLFDIIVISSINFVHE
jgi:hypothetical protein